MDYLWTPWRYQYITTADQAPGCVFCQILLQSDEEAKIVLRAEHGFIVLNAFPYTSGHVMVVPYQHLDLLQKLPPAAATEMMALAQRMEGVLRELYKPDGLNMGMNIGKAAGAGVAGHVHMHILPRWHGDNSFMTTTGETRVLPESLDITWKRIRDMLA
jgi:ATP adenylyltransferase